MNRETIQQLRQLPVEGGGGAAGAARDEAQEPLSLP